MMRAIHEAVLADLLREHPLPRLEADERKKIKSGVRAGFLLFKARSYSNITLKR